MTERRDEGLSEAADLLDQYAESLRSPCSGEPEGDFSCQDCPERGGPATCRAEWQEIVDAAKAVRAAFAPSARRATVPLKMRPMLVRGMLATDEHGPMILINSEESDPKEQVISLWHETLHLLGMTDEFLTEEYALRLADACPDILRRLANNINVPDGAAPDSCK